MMEMKEQTGSRKKLLVPVVVLMLCLVTLTGAAYAYSSTMTNTGNTVDAGMLSIDLKLNNDGTVATDAVVNPGNNVVTFTDNFGYTAKTDKTNWIGYEIATGDIVIVTYKVNVVREAENDDHINLTVGSDDLMNMALFDVSGVSKTVADLFDVKVNIDSAGAVEIAKVGDTAEYNTTKTDLALGEHTVVLTFTKKSTVEATGHTTAARFTLDDPAAPEKDTASDWVAAFATADYQFTLSFKAENYSA